MTQLLLHLLLQFLHILFQIMLQQHINVILQAANTDLLCGRSCDTNCRICVLCNFWPFLRKLVGLQRSYFLQYSKVHIRIKVDWLKEKRKKNQNLSPSQIATLTKSVLLQSGWHMWYSTQTSAKSLYPTTRYSCMSVFMKHLKTNVLFKFETLYLCTESVPATWHPASMQHPFFNSFFGPFILNAEPSYSVWPYTRPLCFSSNRKNWPFWLQLVTIEWRRQSMWRSSVTLNRRSFTLLPALWHQRFMCSDLGLVFPKQSQVQKLHFALLNCILHFWVANPVAAIFPIANELRLANSGLLQLQKVQIAV